MTWETGEWSMEEAKDIVRRGMGVVEDDHAAVEAPFMLEAAIKEIERLMADIKAHQRTIVVMLDNEAAQDEYPSGISPEALREGAKIFRKPQYNEAADIIERAMKEPQTPAIDPPWLGPVYLCQTCGGVYPDLAQNAPNARVCRCPVPESSRLIAYAASRAAATLPPDPGAQVTSEPGQWIATLETGERVAVWPEQVGLNTANYLPHGGFRYLPPGTNKGMDVVDLHGPGRVDTAPTDLSPLLGMSFTFDRARDVTLCAKCGARTVKPKGGLPAAWTHQVPGTRPEDCRMLCDTCAAKAEPAGVVALEAQHTPASDAADGAKHLCGRKGHDRG